MRRLVVVLVVCAVALPTVWAGDLGGVTIPDEISLADGTLKLNGMGIRKKMWVKVYVAGLYLEANTDDATEAVGSEGSKRVVMHFLTDKATKKKMDEAWLEGFEANSREAYGGLEDRVRRFVDFFGDMQVGDVIQMTLVPGTGTTVVLNGDERGVIEGDDFGTALLSVWLGDHPPSDDLKAGLLGG